ncbi:MAG: OmpA family lipoprotein [Alphaproteobacteria bacterium]|nr:MAG: OmpA family lipoprotein [Alphaproteobacteria bacterium]
MKRLVIVAAALSLAACQTATDPLTGRPQVNNTAAGATLGAVTGALTGLLVAKDKSGGDQRKAALIGAGIGALIGGSVGNYMDRQEAELRQHLQATGVSVTRQGEYIILNMPGNVTFATDQDQLNPTFYPVLDSVSIVLNKYPQTLLDIDGHTDSVGSPQYNQALSERRAVSVGQYLASRGVDPRRLLVVGYGQTRPIAANDTDLGRAQNRRVEIRISPLS